MNYKQYIDVLCFKRFYLFLASSTISNAGDWLSLIALMVLCYDKTSSPLGVSSILIARALPTLFLSFYAGAIADRFDRKKVMLFSNILRGCCMFALVFTSNLSVLYSVSLVAAALGSFFNPAAEATIPQIVRKENLPIANSLINVGKMFAMIAGPAAAAMSIKYLGIHATFLMDAISFVLFGVVICFIPIPKLDILTRAKESSILKDVTLGLKFIFAHRSVLVMLASYGAACCTMGALGTLELVFCSKVLLVDASIYGKIVAIAGLGAIFGSLIYTRAGRADNAANIYFLGLCLFGFGISIFSFQTVLLATIPFLLMEGVGESFFSIAARCYLQNVVPSEMLGRIMGHKDLTEKLGMLAGMASAGIMATYFEVKMALLFFGAGLLFLGITLAIRNKMMDEGTMQSTTRSGRQHSRFIRGSSSTAP